MYKPYLLSLCRVCADPSPDRDQHAAEQDTGLTSHSTRSTHTNLERTTHRSNRCPTPRPVGAKPLAGWQSPIPNAWHAHDPPRVYRLLPRCSGVWPVEQAGLMDAEICTHAGPRIWRSEPVLHAGQAQRHRTSLPNVSPNACPCLPTAAYRCLQLLLLVGRRRLLGSTNRGEQLEDCDALCGDGLRCV